MTKFVIALLLFTATSSWAFLPEPVGTHRRGRIENAFELPHEGSGYVRLFPTKGSGWGTFEMIMMIQNSAMALNKLYPSFERVRVGDISRKSGGRLSRHYSHQNGLDVDIAYLRTDAYEEIVGSLKSLTSMVVKGVLSPFFDVERNWEYFKLLHIYGSVQRIFVDRVVKKAVCEYALTKGEHASFDYVLRSLRPFPHHDNHMHVRLRCPDNSQKCRMQPELNVKETGCEQHWKHLAYDQKNSPIIM